MSDPIWNELGSYTVSAKPKGLWTPIVDYLCNQTLLKIKASDDSHWSYTNRTAGDCGPDGDLYSHIPQANCLVPTAAPGCLVGKIGGSTADEGVEQFVVGSHVVHLINKEKTGGPLFLTINDEKAGFGDNSGEIHVTVFTAQAP